MVVTHRVEMSLQYRYLNNGVITVSLPQQRCQQLRHDYHVGDTTKMFLWENLEITDSTWICRNTDVNRTKKTKNHPIYRLEIDCSYTNDTKNDRIT